MSGLFGSAASTATSSALGDLSKDVALTNPPEDSISDLAFNPQRDFLAVASWDKKVRIYEIDGQGQSQGKAMFEHEGPVLSCCWSQVRYGHLLESQWTRTDRYRTARKHSALVPTRLLA